MSIFSIFKRKSSSSVEGKPIESEITQKQTSHIALKKTAKTASDPKERMQAVSGITDQDFLYEIAINDNDFGVGKAAVERLTNQQYLTSIGRDNAAHDWRCRKAAIARMTDKTALQHIIDNEKELTINSAAKERMMELS